MRAAGKAPATGLVRVGMSKRDRWAAFILLDLQEWGGSEEALLTRDETWTALEIDDIDAELTPLDAKGRDAAAAKFAETIVNYDLSGRVVDYLILLFSHGGQNRTLGRRSAAVVRRLRAARGEPEKKAPPGEARPS